MDEWSGAAQRLNQSVPSKRVVKKMKKGKKRAGKKGKKNQLLDDALEPEDFSDYSLGSKLGRGAFGSVYCGLNTATSQMAAVKSVGLRNAASAMSEVEQEIELMKGLNNEHIVKYYGSHRTRDYLLIVMEYADGGSLQHILKKFQPFPEPLISRYMYQVLIGLSYLHKQSVVHRDIKAANILLSNQTAKLSDFGISIKTNGADGAGDGNSNFSAYWSAPEVISMEPVTEKCDIWSLGITAIELYTGQPPYFDLAAIPAAFKIVQGERPPFPEGISTDFRTFLEGCLEKNVQFRKTAEALLASKFITSHNTGNNGGLEDLFGDVVKPSTPKGGEKNDDSQYQRYHTGSPSSNLSSVVIQPLDSVPTPGESGDFDDGDSGLQYRSIIGSVLPPPNLLDGIMDVDDDEEEKERKRRSDLIEKVTTKLQELSDTASEWKERSRKQIGESDTGTLADLSRCPPAQKIIRLCNDLREIFEKEPWIMDVLAASPGIVPMIEIIQCDVECVLTRFLPVLNPASKEQPRLHSVLCVLGVLPSLFEYMVYNKDANASASIVSDETLDLIHIFCTTEPKPDEEEDGRRPKKKGKKKMQRKALQMFVAAGGVTKLMGFLQDYVKDVQVYDETRNADRELRIISRIIDIVYCILKASGDMGKAGTIRIMCRTNFIMTMCQLMTVVPPFDPLITKMCCIYEEFANQKDFDVQWTLTEKDVIDNLFVRARARGVRNNATAGESRAVGMCDADLMTILKSLKNLAMSKEASHLLLRYSNIGSCLIEYLLVGNEAELVMDEFRVEVMLVIFGLISWLDMQDTGMQPLTSALCGSLIGVLVHIMKGASTAVGMATEVFLKIVGGLAHEPVIEAQLRENDCVAMLVRLMQTHSHTGKVIGPVRSWAKVNAEYMDGALCENHMLLITVLCRIMCDPRRIEVQKVVARDLLGIYKLCPRFKDIISSSNLVKVMSEKLIGTEIEGVVDYERCLLKSIVCLYHVNSRPKWMISEFRIDLVARKMSRDPRDEIRVIGRQLLRAITINYVL